jgi:hypothetical protein
MMDCYNDNCSREVATDDDGIPVVADNDGNYYCAPGCKHAWFDEQAEAAAHHREMAPHYLADDYDEGRW